MLNDHSKARLSLVHPRLQAIVEQMDLALEMKGIQIQVVQGLRTMAEQQELYNQGRTAPGRIVTNARPGYSMHNFGCAVDLVPGIRGVDYFEPNWDSQSADFQAMIQCGMGLGLISGSEWKSIEDWPHFQLAGLPVTPTDEMRLVLEEKGLEEFWKEFVA